MLTAPLVAAPYFRSCGAPTHGIYPQPCHPGGTECSPSPEARTEQILATAQTTSVLVLQPWDAMEVCFPAPQPALSAFETSTSPHSDCWIDSDLNGTPEQFPTCHCYWNLDIPGVSVVGPWLREYVAHRPPCTGGRSALIQLGTLFPSLPFPRTVPAYLKQTPFDDPRVIQAFARFWNELSVLLASPEFNATRFENGTLFIDPAEFVISIGNEIDLYLDAPLGVDGSPTQAWSRYASFYRKAADYVRARPVDLDGDGIAEPNTSARGFTRTVTFSSTWRECSPGWRLARSIIFDPCDLPSEPLQTYAGMASNADFWSFTRYVPFEGYDPPPADVYATARQESREAFDEMGFVSTLAQIFGVTPTARPLLIQEMGFPSSRFAPDDNLLAGQQALFVAGAFDAWTDYNAQWIALPDWWELIRTGQSWNPLDAPGARPRALGFNWFLLHDFSNPLDPDPNNCPFATDDAGTQFCSWGLLEADGTPKLAALVYLNRSQAVNPPSRDPDRSCE